MPDPYKDFSKEVEEMISQLTQRLKRGGFSRTELAQLSAEINFFEELRGLGFEELVDEYFSNYDKVITDVLKKAKLNGVDIAAVNTEQLLLVKELDKDFLLKKASLWGSQYESELVKSIIRGDAITQTIKNLEGIPLTDSQLGTVINTSYADFERMTVRTAYEDEPEQRFRYVGPLIPTSSDICIAMMEEQNPEGYTSDEIAAGISTGGGIVNWGGRVPNYNCNHTWEPI